MCDNYKIILYFLFCKCKNYNTEREKWIKKNVG